MRTLRNDGWNKVLEGVTTLEEVLRVTEEDEALSEAETGMNEGARRDVNTSRP